MEAKGYSNPNSHIINSLILFLFSREERDLSENEESLPWNGRPIAVVC